MFVLAPVEPATPRPSLEEANPIPPLGLGSTTAAHVAGAGAGAGTDVGGAKSAPRDRGAMSPGPATPVRVLFVCLGNICRSPQAEGLMAAHVRAIGLQQAVHVDSAGTSGWHEGELPDRRTRAASARHGVELTSRSRPFVVEDFDRFDYIVAMDRANVVALCGTARDAADRARVSLLRTWDPAADGDEVPDPYYGAGDGFERVFQMCDAATRGLLAAIRARHGL